MTKTTKALARAVPLVIAIMGMAAAAAMFIAAKRADACSTSAPKQCAINMRNCMRNCCTEGLTT